jgi:hypothetical protein
LPGWKKLFVSHMQAVLSNRDNSFKTGTQSDEGTIWFLLFGG